MSMIIKNEDEACKIFAERYCAENDMDNAFPGLEKLLKYSFKAGINWERTKTIPDEDTKDTEDRVTIFNDFVAVMKEHGYKYAIIYRYDRDNDGDLFEYDMRESWDEYSKWPDDCMNGTSVNGIYADDIDKAWDKVVEYAIWKDPIINPETDGIYDESIMSPGETLSIIVRIDEAGFAKIGEEFGYH